MKLYILSVVCISAIGMLINMLTPDGEGGGISKNTRLIYGLCVVLVCIYPIKNAINALYEFDLSTDVENAESSEEELREIFKSSFSSAEIENLKNGIKQILFEKFSVDPSECKIEALVVENESEERDLKRILVTLYGSAIWKDTGAIEDHLSSLLSCDVVTAIG